MIRSVFVHPQLFGGVRSLLFSRNTLSIGSAKGRMAFFDLVGDKFMTFAGQKEDGTKYERPYHSTTECWTDPVHRGDFRAHHAIYTHNYDPSGARLFVGGGPLLLHLRGGYAAMW